MRKKFKQKCDSVANIFDFPGLVFFFVQAASVGRAYWGEQPS